MVPLSEHRLDVADSACPAAWHVDWKTVSWGVKTRKGRKEEVPERQSRTKEKLGYSEVTKRF